MTAEAQRTQRKTEDAGQAATADPPLQKLDEMIGGGLVTLEKVRVILYRSSQK